MDRPPPNLDAAGRTSGPIQRWYLSYAPVGLTHVAVRAWLAVAGFGLVVLAWSLLAVAGSDLAAEGSNLPQGEAMGLYAASGAVAAVIGSLLGGVVATLTGYAGLLWIASASMFGALALTRRRKALPPADGAAPTGHSPRHARASMGPRPGHRPAKAQCRPVEAAGDPPWNGWRS
jgi:MFS family permease